MGEIVESVMSSWPMSSMSESNKRWVVGLSIVTILFLILLIVSSVAKKKWDRKNPLETKDDDQRWVRFVLVAFNFFLTIVIASFIVANYKIVERMPIFSNDYFPAFVVVFTVLEMTFMMALCGSTQDIDLDPDDKLLINRKKLNPLSNPFHWWVVAWMILKLLITCGFVFNMLTIWRGKEKLRRSTHDEIISFLKARK